jgi:hypothetical protein
MGIPLSFSVFHWGRICCPSAALVPRVIVKSAIRLCRLAAEIRTGGGSHNVNWRRWSRTFPIQLKASRLAHRTAGVQPRRDRAPCRLHRNTFRRQRSNKYGRLWNTQFMHNTPIESDRRADDKIAAGCSKNPSSKAATSEDRRRTLWGTLRI